MSGTFFKSGALIESTTTIATAAGTTTLTQTSPMVIQFTGSTTQTLQLPNATTLSIGRSFYVTNRSTGLVTVTYNDSSTAVLIPSGSQTLLFVISNGTSNGTWDISTTGSGSGSGTGKNYLTTYTASFGNNAPNTGNGNFEQASTTGWSLAHSTISTANGYPVPTSVASAGSAFSSSSGGSAATALAFNAVTNFSLTTTGTLTNGSNQITSVASTSGIVEGTLVTSGTAGLPTTAFVVDVVGSTVYLNSNFTGTTTPGATITFKTAPLGGSYSGSLSTLSTAASPPNSTVGDMVISSAFFIDQEDQAKMMTIKFYYQDVSDGSTLAFPGTSSNSFGIWIYDVTNAAWIQPQGTYNLIQSSGVGYATATFQTTSTSTEYQLALININASVGAYALYVDDFQVGPQTAPIGPAVTDWQTYTVTITGSTSNPTKGTRAIDQGNWRRVGDSMEIRYDYQQTGAGSAGSGFYRFSIPSGYTVDTTKLPLAGDVNPEISYAGTGAVSDGTNEYICGATIDNATSKDVTLLAFTTGGSGTTTQVGSTTVPLSGTTARYSFLVFVPIVGWSSNVSMSNDTDTRVVAARANTSTTTISSDTTIVYTLVDYDTHGSYSTSTGVYTVPVSGKYVIKAGLVTTSQSWVAGNTVKIDLFKNGSATNGGAAMARSFAQTTYTGRLGTYGSDTLNLIAGDQITLRGSMSTAGALDTGSDVWFSIERVSGPAVIAATETVQAVVTTSSSSITTSQAVAIFTVKAIDTHGAYSTSTGNFTCPVSGKYEVSSFWSTTSATASSFPLSVNMYVFKNGSEIYRNGVFLFQQSTQSGAAPISGAPVTIQCNAGDTLAIFSNMASGISAMSLTGSALDTWASFKRVGN